MSTLIELNALRTAANMKPLKAWKESKAKLDAAIAKLTGIPADQAKQVEVTKVPTGMTAAKAEAAAKKVAKKASKPASAKAKPLNKGAQAKKDSADNILSTVAAELDINTKVARAKLRREFGLKEEGKWPSTVKDMKAFLEGDKRKKD